MTTTLHEDQLSKHSRLIDAVPIRVQNLITAIADRHEVSSESILSRNSTRAVEIARLECYRRLLAEPKPNGALPSKAEVARWCNRDHATISLAVKEPAA
jgi:chromosomal replication initiation ATPase DnaA